MWARCLQVGDINTVLPVVAYVGLKKPLLSRSFLGFLLRCLTLNVPGPRRFLAKTLYAVPCKAASRSLLELVPSAVLMWCLIRCSTSIMYINNDSMGANGNHGSIMILVIFILMLKAQMIDLILMTANLPSFPRSFLCLRPGG